MSGRGFSNFGYLSLAALLLVALALGSSTARAQVPGPIKFTIESAHGVLLGDTVDVPILLDNDSSGFALGALVLAVRYDTTSLTLANVAPGPLMVECGWEDFSYSDSFGVIHMVALANYLGGQSQPTCHFQEASGDSIVMLTFAVTDDPDFECSAPPVEFYWVRCADNTASDTTGVSTYYSNLVVDSDGFQHSSGSTLPTNEGAPDTCVGVAPNNPRAIDFYSGYVDIKCIDSVDFRGDLNLNGIANEIGDWVVYQNYFLYGLIAFQVNLEAQIAASDVNNDGLTLTVRDLAYLLRIIIGDALPFPKPVGGTAPGDTALFIQDTGAHTVTMSYPDSLVEILLLFNGQITPSNTDSTVSIGYQNEYAGQTRVLISPPLWNYPLSGINSGELFSYTGEGTLVSAEVGDWRDGVVSTRIAVSSGNSTCGDVDGNSVVNLTDAIQIVQYIFANGSAPGQFGSGDLDCDGIVNISDVIYLVTFIFNAGPSPCDLCP